MFDVFISSPYSDEDRAVVDDRVKLARQYVAQLALADTIAFSVIAYIHPMLEEENKLPTDYEFWRRLCMDSMEVCREVHVLCVDGWETSVGVQDEIDVARSLNKTIRYITDI